MIYWPCYVLMRLVDLVYFRTKYIGREHIPKDQPFLLVCNHVSNIDPFIVGICRPRRFSFLAKEELFKGAFANWLFRGMGAFPIKRGRSDFGALRQALKRLKSGTPLILFPEGTRGTGSVKKKANPGVGFLAVKSGLPVVPAFIEGSDGALPNGAKWFRFHPVKVTFGPPVNISTEQKFPDISQEILRSIYALHA